MNIWQLNEGGKYIKNLSHEAWRVVEAQHVLSSRDLVDSPEEHNILEDLLEESKPPINKEKNYLIFTPFRYPPLKYGSRFGSLFEPSLWYGSLNLETAFAEVAYYRFRFLSETTGELGFIDTPLTAFTAYLDTEKGVDLTVYPFNRFTQEISNQNTYEYSQALGSSMRKEKVEAFLYFSARSRELSSNIAAFIPKVFKKKKNQYIHHQQTWLCIANQQYVEFKRIGILHQEHHIFQHSECVSTE